MPQGLLIGLNLSWTWNSPLIIWCQHIWQWSTSEMCKPS